MEAERDFEMALVVNGNSKDGPVKISDGSLSDLFNDKSMVHNLLIITFLWTACSFSFYLSAQMMQTEQGDLFMNQVVTASAILSGKVLCFALNQKLSAKKSLVAFFMIAHLPLRVQHRQFWLLHEPLCEPLGALPSCICWHNHGHMQHLCQIDNGVCSHDGRDQAATARDFHHSTQLLCFVCSDFYSQEI